MAARGAFISDLHLLSKRSVGEQHWEQFRPELKKLDLLILGGDIFDFRWSVHGDLLTSLEQARQWLYRALEADRRIRLIYMLGNHDCHPAMQQLLREVAEESERFCWSEHQLVLNQNIFLHGDILDAGLTFPDLHRYRSQFSQEHKEKSDLAHKMYDLVVASRIHSVPPQLFHYPSRVVRRLSKYLSTLDLGPEQGIEDVFFGHTHRPLTGFTYAGQRFFNSGSAVRHLPFVPCFFQCEADLDEVVSKLTETPEIPLRV
jgi:UDP-2,3-diacylglucosamine hydrolase